MKLGVADLKPDYEPGSFGFDPLGLYPKVRHAEVVLMLRVRERVFWLAWAPNVTYGTSEETSCVGIDVRAWNF